MSERFERLNAALADRYTNDHAKREDLRHGVDWLQDPIAPVYSHDQHGSPGGGGYGARHLHKLFQT